MKKVISFMLCISLLLGFSFGCVISSENSQSESLVESQSESLQETASENETLSEQESEPQSELIGEEKIGGVYTLQALYEAGKLTQEDLLNIAYYSNNAQYNTELMGEDFVPTVEATLTPELENELKETIANVYRTRKINPWVNAKPEWFEIKHYYGYYNGYHILKYDNGMDGIYQGEKLKIVEMGGVKFGFKLIYHDTYIEGVNLDVDDGSVLKVNGLDPYEYYHASRFDYCQLFNSIDEAISFFKKTQMNMYYFIPNFDNVRQVSVKNQEINLCYSRDVEDYEYSQKIKYSSAFTVSAEIEDTSLIEYIYSSNLSIMISSGRTFDIYDTEGIILEKYRYIDDLAPEYNYVVIVYKEEDNGCHNGVVWIYYYAEQDIPLEYFEKLFTEDLFEWVQA